MATKLILGKNDLNTVNPSLAAEWDFSKNDGLLPIQVTAGSNKKVWWLGKCGHNWQATIASRNSGVGCPVCARMNNAIKVQHTRARKSGSLLELYPLLAKEWNYEKNGQLMPESISPGSHKAVWWKCEKCGAEWQAIIRNRVHGSNCPYCKAQHNKKERKPRIIVPLSVSNPSVLNEWNYDKNTSVDPSNLSLGSHTKVWWKCEKGHEWIASPNHRFNKGRGCPYCCQNPRVLPGENDLATVHPELLDEWDFEKNGRLRPQDVTASSSKSVWWKCALGHEWKTSINHRVDGSGCPKCASGKQTSFPEQAIYYYVLKGYPDAINGFTDIFKKHGMELDVYVPSLSFGIEYDGAAYHRSDKQKQREFEKYQICREHGIKLVRIRERNDVVAGESSDYLISAQQNIGATIRELCQYLPGIVDVDVERDRTLILSNYRNMLERNSLLSKDPELAKEWNFEKNGTLTPGMFEHKSNQKVWWKCKLGHEWQAQIDSRVRGTGCPYCNNNRVLPGFNDLKSQRPDLMAEWFYDKNQNLDPSTILPGSGKKAWWKCAYGHVWQAEISSRNKGHGCPYCARIKDWEDIHR